MKSRRTISLLTIFAAAVAVSLPAAAAAAAAAPPPEVRAQVDGLTSRVIDNLWETTDVFWHEGDYNRIVALLRVCVEAEPSFTEAYSSGAWLLWSMGDTPAADAFLEHGIQRAPVTKKWEIQYELGWHLFNTKRFAAALPYLQAAVKYPAAPSLPHKILAHCYDRLGRIAESAAVWRTVVRKFPEDRAGQSNLTRVEAKLSGKPPAP